TRRSSPASRATLTKPPTASCNAPDTADASPKPVSAHLGYVRGHDDRRGTDTGPNGCARHTRAAERRQERWERVRGQAAIGEG
ncbi:hypothetical protein BD309DRAFT_914646, partial [Dichomitus squalens]